MSDLTIPKVPNRPNRHHHVKDALTRADYLCCGLLTLLVICVFSRTVIAGSPISRVYQLVERDSVFSSLRTGIASDYDCSIYQSLVPYYFLVAETFNSGHIPLWNPYSGCGAPFVADILTTAFAPLRLILLPWVSLYTYNLTLVLQIVLAVVGTFILSRALALSRWASCFTAITYAFCPYIVFSNELQGTSTSIFPFVLWLFVRMSNQPTWSRGLAVGIGCAVLILSGHPELSFFGILFSSFLFVCLTMSDRNTPLRTRVSICIRSMVVAACVAFFLSAPVLLPFVEYLSNSECYKSSLHSFVSIVPLSRIIYNLAQPAFGSASPYLGIVAALLLPVALLMVAPKNRVLQCLAITDLLVLGVISRLGPFDFLLRQKFLSWLILDDAFPMFLLMTAVVAAFGFDAVRESALSNRRNCIVLFCTAIVIFSLPWCWHMLKLPLESAYIAASFKQMTLDFRSWTRDLIIFAITLGVLIFPWHHIRNQRFLGLFSRSKIIGLAILVLGFTSEASIAKHSMPLQPHFEYSAVQPLDFLQEQHERIVTMGRHVFYPNSNFVYGIANLVTPNVLYPARFLDFVKAAGITVEGVNQFFDGKLSPIVDLASVRYVVSSMPVFSTGNYVPALPEHTHTSEPVAAPGVTVRRSSLSYDQENQQAVGLIEWSVSLATWKRFSFSAVVSNQNNETLWFGDRLPLGTLVSVESTGTGVCRTEITALVPSYLAAGTLVRVGVQVFDSVNACQLPGTLVPIAQLKVAGQTTGSHTPKATIIFKKTTARRFRLVSETLRDHIRVYENLKALPQAYLVHHMIAVDSRGQALQTIQSPLFEPTVSVVLEATQLPPVIPEPANQHSPAQAKYVNLKRTGPNEVLVNVIAQHPGYLVLTDAYYPGWHAYLDGKQVPLYCANYLFRSVFVPSGTHQVRFSFEPISFLAGVILFALCLSAMTVFYALSWSRHRTTSNK